jgi:lipoprotein-anchoring transpeptidase ErfK/SrfK
MTKRFASLYFIGSAFLILPHMAMAASTATPQQSYNVPDAQPAGEPAQAPAAASSSYGGGFLEFLLTGGGALASAPSAARTTTASTQAPEAEPSAVQRAIDPIYLRQEVDYTGPERPGTIVIDTPNKFLFLVEKDGRALRYGIGVGRPGFAWAGIKTISRKAEWPDWTPPPDMLKRRPDLPLHMDGGPENPLGARALYLGSSLYRIHGTNEPYTIGTNVSSGCIRMMNEDVIDLYNRVSVGTKVIVM